MIFTVLIALATAADPNLQSITAINSDDNWKTVTVRHDPSAGDIQIRHNELDGVDCLEASATTPVSVGLLQEIILDIPGNRSWSSAALTRSSVLSNGSNHIDYVQVLDMPGPLADRYWFLRGAARQQASTWTFSWTHLDAAEHYPGVLTEIRNDAPNAVVVDINVGSWSLSELNGETLARFRSCTNAGGAVPRWLGEKTALLMLPNNITDLFQEAQRRGP